MSFDPSRENNEDGKLPSKEQANPNVIPYDFSAFPAPVEPVSAPVPQRNPVPKLTDQNPSAPSEFNNQNQSSFFQVPHNATPPKDFQILGLNWRRNVIPNPATNGAPPTDQKSVGVAYFLWLIMFGMCGIHQFYLGNTKKGVFNLVLGLAFYVLSSANVGAIQSSQFGLLFGLVYFSYWIYDAVTLREQTREINNGFIRKSIL